MIPCGRDNREPRRIGSSRGSMKAPSALTTFFRMLPPASRSAAGFRRYKGPRIAARHGLAAAKSAAGLASVIAAIAKQATEAA